jgi:hypothetical protein
MSISSTGLSKHERGAARGSDGAKLEPGTELESSTTLARRLDRSRRTIERYVRLGILPPPFKIRGKNFFIKGVTPKLDGDEPAAA